MSEIFQSIKQSLTMKQVAEHFGYKVNHTGFILSPFGKEKTASCKLYGNSYYDFSTASGGDLIKFTAAILHINNWEACQYLTQAFSLPVSLSGFKDSQGQIKRRQQEQQRRQERQQDFRSAWIQEVDKLKLWEKLYQSALEKQIFPVLSELWIFVVNGLQEVSYKLDVLCAADQEVYYRMKPDTERELPSERPKWLLDTLAILAESGEFKVTQSELAEIQAQRNFEWNGKPRKDRAYGSCMAAGQIRR